MSTSQIKPSQLTQQEKQMLIAKDLGQSSAFKHLAVPYRVSRIGTVVINSDGNIYVPQQLFSKADIPVLKKQSTTNVQQEINYNISPWVGWVILFFSVFISALAPAWLSWDLKSQSFTRNSWRYFFQTALLLPFYLYERRVYPIQSQKQLRKINNILVVFKNSLQYVVFYFFFICSAKLTSVNHAIYLSNTIIFWKLIFRMYNAYSNKDQNQQIHQFEKGGAGMMIISFLLVFFDSLYNPIIQNPPVELNYLRHRPIVRLIGDFIGLFTAFLLTYMQQNFKTINELPTPPLQTSLMYNGLISLSLSALGYFCGGSQISFNSLYGMFGLFTITNFVRIFYVAILLGMGIMITNVFTNIIFPATIISISGIIQPLISSILLHAFGSQSIPFGFTCIGFSFMIPGLLMIIAGRSALVGAQMRFNYNLSIRKNQ